MRREDECLTRFCEWEFHNVKDDGTFMYLYEYQKDGRYFAQVASGFEEAAADELRSLGATGIDPSLRGLHFSADPSTLYAINYQTRLVTRILAPLASFQCRDRTDLYRAARAIPWHSIFSIKHTFGVFANVSGNRQLNHSKFAALCVKDAVADAFRQETDRRPDVDRFKPDLWINLHLVNDRATISLDTSGGSLHRRGYRRQSVKAPMQETLAAAIVAASQWHGERPLYDPMCGSGTLLCEALMRVCRIPAGYMRGHFGFRFLPDYDRKSWEQVKRAADRKVVPLKPGLICGSDIDPQAVRAAGANLRALPGGDVVSLLRADIYHLKELENRTILCNPPYGLRLDGEAGLGSFYKSLGDFLKQRCKGSEAYIYFGNREMLKRIGLRPAWKKPLRNADLDGRLAKFELY